MQEFSFTRFATLLIRVLEVSIIAALLSRWIAVFLIVRPETNALGGTALDVASNFSFLAVVLLLVGDLWLLLTRRPHAVFATVRSESRGAVAQPEVAKSRAGAASPVRGK
jgi:hypothetical protein